MLHLLSLGAGVQSSTAALMYEHGELSPKPDAAVFADTEQEPAEVYLWLDWLERQVSYPIHRVSRGDLREAALAIKRTRDGQRSYIKTAIPAHMTTDDGMRAGIGMRACTRDFKIAVINAKARQLLGGGAQRGDEIRVMMAIGISIDEADRMKPNPRRWIRSHWPLIDVGMSRADCQAWMQKNGYPQPPRSACKFCPYRSDDHWLSLPSNEFAEAVQFERDLQAAYAQASAVRSIPYLHESRVPLDQVKLRPGRINMKAQQLNMFRNDCVGMCGV
jgi:hypothetical protein